MATYILTAYTDVYKQMRSVTTVQRHSIYVPSVVGHCSGSCRGTDKHTASVSSFLNIQLAGKDLS